MITSQKQKIKITWIKKKRSHAWQSPSQPRDTVGRGNLPQLVLAWEMLPFLWSPRVPPSPEMLNGHQHEQRGSCHNRHRAQEELSSPMGLRHHATRPGEAIHSHPSSNTIMDHRESPWNEINKAEQSSATKALKTKFVTGTTTHKKYARTCMLHLE